MKRFFGALAKLDWTNTTFLIGTPILGFAGFYYWIASGNFNWPTFFLFLFMTIMTGGAITGGYHRLFAHKSYEAKPFYRLFMLLFGAAAFQNTALRWASDHRNHHKFVDTDKDPYNINRGFWYAHMGWVMLRYDNKHRYDNVKDLEHDKLIMFQHNNYVALGIGVGLVFPALVAALWGDWFGGLFVAGIFRTVMNHHFTFSINSFSHLYGTRPYSDQDSSRDNWFLALFTYGEGYHNYHHKFPSDYRNGIRAYHWDPTKWVIKAMEGVLTYRLRKIPNETIMRARLRMDEKRIMKKIEMQQAQPAIIPQEFVTAARLKIEEAHIKFLALKAEYQKLRQERIDAFHVKVEHVNQQAEILKRDIHSAREAFSRHAAEWSRLCSHFGVSSSRLVLN
jgi:stearoyl-CoA desaturase (delta-9 desaturase)